MVDLLAEELGVSRDGFDDDDEDLSAFGVDSITGAALVGRLSHVFGQVIHPWDFQDELTVAGVSRAVRSMAEKVGASSGNSSHGQENSSYGAPNTHKAFDTASFVRPKTTYLSPEERERLRKAERDVQPIAYILVGLAGVVMTIVRACSLGTPPSWLRWSHSMNKPCFGPLPYFSSFFVDGTCDKRNGILNPIFWPCWTNYRV